MHARLRSLYICYLSLDDPLVETQVVAYLAGLVRAGHQIHLLTFEPGRLTRARRAAFRERLRQHGITWHGLRYHKRPSLPATALDVMAGAVLSAWLVRRHRLQVLHARSHMPAAMALLGRFVAPRARFIFDIRGLMAEEYEDARRWRRGSIPFRLTKLVERRGLAVADGIVVLTERVKQHLFDDARDNRVHVIPCCADVDQIQLAADARSEVRDELGLDNRPVLVYVGKFTGWYLQDAMVDFYMHARELVPDLHFLVLTQSDRRLIEAEFTSRGVGPEDWTARQVTPDAVGSHLAAADAAIAFIKPTFSKISSSPTKIGEYLAAGLPVITGAGVGDVDSLLEHAAGVLLRDFSPVEMRRGAHALNELMGDPTVCQRNRTLAARSLSLRDVGIPAYERLYRSLAEPPVVEVEC